ncbi:hypothetical protein J6590_005003 [Homalodisca vitripennis]|nr:hypothetical protein J6590_005003 [Homalodisca vitripennis]
MLICKLSLNYLSDNKRDKDLLSVFTKGCNQANAFGSSSPADFFYALSMDIIARVTSDRSYDKHVISDSTLYIH